MTMLPRNVLEILRSRRRKVFLVGAGISKVPPTAYPLAAELVAGLLDSASEGRPWILPYTSMVEDSVRRGIPGCRLEVLLEIARQHTGNQVLRLLSFLEHGIPNVFHYLLAWQLRRGHTVLTTNFDTMIELAYSKVFGASRRLQVLAHDREFARAATHTSDHGVLAKFHGSIRDGRGRRSYGSIQATLASIANGLTRGKRQFLVSMLQQYDFIVLGYSGCDDFDVNKVWVTVRPRGRFLWVRHASSALNVHSAAALPPSIPDSDPVRKLLAATSTSYVIEGVTTDLLPYIPGFSVSSRAVTWSARAAYSWIDKLKAQFREWFIVTDIDCIRFLAKVLEYNGELSAARTCLELGISRATGLERATLLDDLGQCCLQLRSFADSFSYRLAARRAAIRSKDPAKEVIIARTWLGVAECLRHTTQYSKSLSAFRKAKEHFQRLNIRDRVGYCLSGVAGIYRMKSRFSKASVEYAAAAREFAAGKDLPGQLYALWGLGEVYKYTGRLSNAKAAYESVREQAEKLGHQRLIGLAIWGNAEILRLSWQVIAAKKAYNEAYEAFPGSDVAGRSWALEGMAQCLILSGDSPLRVLRDAETGFKKLGAAIGLATTRIDRAAFEIRCGFLAGARHELDQVDQQGLPRKDRLNYKLVLAEITARTDTASARRIFTRTYHGYKRLGMVLQAVGTGILLLSRCGSKGPSRLLSTLEREAMVHGFQYELNEIRVLKARKTVNYNLNMC